MFSRKEEISKMNFSLILSQLVNGLQTGSVYALVALGYSMVYGIILLLNFAHGDIIMIGAYTAFYAMTTFQLHPLFSVLLAVIVSTVLGVVIEKVAYTPLRSAPRLSLLITAIGVSFLLENGAQLLFLFGEVAPALEEVYLHAPYRLFVFLQFFARRQQLTLYDLHAE